MKYVKIGLIGFGTIGRGVYELLASNAALIEKRSGIRPYVHKICDINTEALPPDVAHTTDWRDIVSDPEIDIVVELIGGIEPAKSIITEAIKNGKSAVTANKKLLAEEGEYIFLLASESEAKLGFEAAVGGGIPCLLSLRAGMVSNRIRSIMGILNGTTNYILTMMEQKGLSFAEALSQAQQKGFAEADPTFDIEGYDAGHKITLLAMMAYNQRVDFKRVPIEGISSISDIDISFARDMGYTIKLLGIAYLEKGELDIRVHPAMIPSTHPLASTRSEFNAIMYDGDMTGPIVLNGRGAGGLPTASAVISDIVQIAQAGEEDFVHVRVESSATIIDPEKRSSKYYLRILSKDAPGMLANIAGVFGKYDISIASVMQKETGEEYVPLIILTHTVNEANILIARKEIEAFEYVKGDITLIRVEEPLFSGEPR